MSRLPPPGAEAQLAFLAKLQRLLAEGDFTATYKFALLVALADLAAELGTDDGQGLELSTRRIGERFVHLYWRHAAAYGTGRPGTAAGVLVQNLGDQAAVLSAIVAFRARAGVSTPQQATAHPDYAALLFRVTATVSDQPLRYLQNFGGTTDAFLYARPGPGRVRLLPGVAYCLRRFYSLVQQLARAHWVTHIKANRRNHAILGDAGDLEDFLFATSRQSLQRIGEGLRRLDGERCFYCGLALGASADVDHYVPFSLYPRDLAHNFVLAHPACNRSKSDSLAGRVHLQRWLDPAGEAGGRPVGDWARGRHGRGRVHQPASGRVGLRQCRGQRRTRVAGTFEVRADRPALPGSAGNARPRREAAGLQGLRKEPFRRSGQPGRLPPAAVDKSVVYPPAALITR